MSCFSLALFAFALALADGKSQEESRLRGDSAPSGYMPYLGVAIVKEAAESDFELQDIDLCSVILVSSNWILTSTNCLLNKNSSVYFGTNKWCKIVPDSYKYNCEFDTGYQKSTVKRVIIHPNFGQIGSRSRASLQMAELNTNIQPASNVAFAKFGEEDIKMGTDFLDVAGWGESNHYGTPICNLRKMELPVFAQEYCEAYGASGLRNDEFCAGDIQGKSYTCSMDAGSPLVKKGEVYGLVSYNTDCSKAHPVGVYLNLHNYRSWIKKTIEE